MKANATGKTKETDCQGKPMPVAGSYHMLITRVNDTRKKKDGSVLPYTIVSYQVLAGSPPAQEGKEFDQFIGLDNDGNETPEYIEKCTRLCMAAGVIRGGEERDVSPDELVNCQVVVKLESFKAKKEGQKDGLSVGSFGMDIWGVDSPEVASIPKDVEAIRIWRQHGSGGQGGGGNGNGQSGNGSANGNGQGGNTAAVAAAGAAGGPNDLSDI